MNGNRYYGVRLEGAKYGVGFGSALAIAISYTNNHSILWAIIHGILGWLYVIYVRCLGDTGNQVVRMARLNPGFARRRPDTLRSSALRSCLPSAQAAFATFSGGAVSIARM